MRRVLTGGFLLLVWAPSAVAGPPPVQQTQTLAVIQAVPSPTPHVVNAAGTPVVVHSASVAAQPCPCEQRVRPGRIWLFANRPIVYEERRRYEPRIRDIRYASPSSTLPGAGLGASDTLFVLPPYNHREGYFRLFETR